MNFSNNFALYGLESYQSPPVQYQTLNPPNYQQFSFPQYFWVDENSFLQNSPAYLPYVLQPCLTGEMSFMDPQSSFVYQKYDQNKVIQIQTPINQLALQKISVNYIQNQQNQPKQPQRSFSFFSNGKENQKLSQSTIEKPENEDNKEKNNLFNSQQFGEKKQIQNLRYQRKNIEANIVNKIYTYLKTCLKSGQRLSFNLLKSKEKASVYYKVLEKLEKAKKQNIKREFIKGFISMQSSVPGYTKIAKELLKKGESIQQFQYNIRVIIKNYLRFDAINSILTSKKMNPLLWKGHIQKIRELEEYLFSAQQKQNEP